MRRNVKRELEAAVGSSFLHLGAGNCFAVKVGRISFSSAEVAENVMLALSQILARVPSGAPNVQSVHIKTATSVALPLYNSLPG